MPRLWSVWKMGNGIVGTVEQEGCSLAETLRDLPLEVLIPRWNKLFWWAGVRPMFQRMVEMDLTLAESIVLRSLQHGPLTVADAAACLMLSQSAASRAVDRLVRDGFVQREENPEDRRQKRLTLAPKGAVLVGEMEGIFADRLCQMVGALDPNEREVMRTLMAKMIAVSATTLEEPLGNWSALRGRHEADDE